MPGGENSLRLACPEAFCDGFISTLFVNERPISCSHSDLRLERVDFGFH